MLLPAVLFVSADLKSSSKKDSLVSKLLSVINGRKFENLVRKCL